MEFLKDVLAKVLEKEEIRIVLPDLSFNLIEIIEIESYKTLQETKGL